MRLCSRSRRHLMALFDRREVERGWKTLKRSSRRIGSKMFFAKALRATRLRRGSRREDLGCGEIDCVTAECRREIAVVLVGVPRCLSREAGMGTSESVESESILLAFIETQRASQPR